MPNPQGGLAPDTKATSQKLTDTINAVALVNGYATALQNVTITPLPGQGAWFGPFNTSLKLAQSHGQNWTKTLGPQAFSQVPQSIINYGTTFTNATADILGIVATVPTTGPLAGTLTTAQKAQVVALIGAVLTELTKSQKTLTTVQSLLQQFSADIGGDYKGLTTGQNAANKEMITDQGQLAVIQSKINGINDKIKADSQKAMMSELGIGIGLFVLVVAIAFAIATEGAAIPLVIGAIAVLGIGGAIAGTVIFSLAVQKDYADLTKEQLAFSDEQKQVAGLQSIINSINTLVASCNAATTAMAAILDTWAVLIAKMKSVVDDLTAANNDAALAILEKLDIQDANTAWGQLVTFAQGMQTSAESFTVQVLKQNPPQQAAA